MEGKVKWFDPQKGYGFIEFEGKDIFVHYKDIVGEGFRALKTGEIVEFDIEETDRGFRAKNVREKKEV